MKIRCIDAGDHAHGYLTIGRTYEALTREQSDFRVKDDSGSERWWRATRFTAVTEHDKEWPNVEIENGELRAQLKRYQDRCAELERRLAAIRLAADGKA